MIFQRRYLLQIYLVVGVFGLTTFAEAQETNSAEVVFLGQLKQDTLSTIGQTRYYKLIMTAGLEVTLTLNPTGFDAKLLVYRANSVDEISSAIPLIDLDESEVVEEVTRVLTVGTYIICVADFDNRGTGTFVLSTSTPLAALFSFTRRYGPAPLTINFTDLSPGTSLWSWDFGDGATSTDQNPSHTYTQSGAYTVNLIVANIVPEIDTLTTAIIVDWFEDGNVDLGDGTWVLDLDTMDGDQGLRNLNVDEGQAFAVEVIANRSVTDALELTLDVIYNPAYIEPTTNIEGTVFPTEIDWAVSEGGLSSFAVSAVSPVSFEASGVGTISFKALSGFTAHTEIWIVRAQTVHVNSVDTSRPYSSVVVKSNVPVAPVGPFVLVDCDGDGDVDFQDFLIFVGAFGSQIGDSRYIASCNFNGDSTIDFSDFLIFATNFGRSPDE